VSLWNDIGPAAAAGLALVALGIVLVVWLFATGGTGDAGAARYDLIDLVFRAAGVMLAGRAALDGAQYIASGRGGKRGCRGGQSRNDRRVERTHRRARAARQRENSIAEQHHDHDRDHDVGGGSGPEPGPEPEPDPTSNNDRSQ
jgi:hypothetical protein